MIDIEKSLCSLSEVKLTPEQKKHIKDSLRYVDAPYKFFMFKVINSLKEQGLEYKEGKIVEIKRSNNSLFSMLY